MWKGKKIREIRKSQKKFWPFLVAKRFSQTKSLQTAQPAAHWAVGRAVFYKEERRRLHGNCEGVCARFLDGFYLTLTDSPHHFEKEKNKWSFPVAESGERKRPFLRSIEFSKTPAELWKEENLPKVRALCLKPVFDDAFLELLHLLP